MLELIHVIPGTRRAPQLEHVLEACVMHIELMLDELDLCMPGHQLRVFALILIGPCTEVIEAGDLWSRGCVLEATQDDGGVQSAGQVVDDTGIAGRPCMNDRARGR